MIVAIKFMELILQFLLSSRAFSKLRCWDRELWLEWRGWRETRAESENIKNRSLFESDSERSKWCHYFGDIFSIATASENEEKIAFWMISQRLAKNSLVSKFPYFEIQQLNLLYMLFWCPIKMMFMQIETTDTMLQTRWRRKRAFERTEFMAKRGIIKNHLQGRLAHAYMLRCFEFI